MKNMGIFRSSHMQDGSYQVRDVTGVTITTCPTRPSADMVMRALYRKWPIEHPTPEYADWVASPVPFGTWPGDETDAELLAKLDEVRG